MIEKSRKYAIQAHADVNHMYDKKYPYSYHLSMVAMVATQYLDLIPPAERNEVLSGCWVHDLIEDARQTYNDVKKNTNESIAEYAYALANEKGKDRKGRANEKYYREMVAYKHAVFIKLCDRFANAKYSKETGSSMFEKYQKEMVEFRAHLYDGRYQKLWDALEKFME